jgi:arginyl-tRNA synthetase
VSRRRAKYGGGAGKVGGLTSFFGTDGTSIYIARDVAGAAQRYDQYKFDKMIYVVAAQQDLHNRQLFKMLDLMGYEWADRLEHVNFGERKRPLNMSESKLITRKPGLVLGMSTRKGTVKFLDEILAEAKDSMHEQMARNAEKYAQIEDPEYTSDVVGQTAVKIQDMSARR